MSELRFKCEDFDGIPLDHGAIKLLVQGAATDIANARLDEMLRDAQGLQGMVLGKLFVPHCVHSVIYEHSITHRAKLVQIEEIK